MDDMKISLSVPATIYSLGESAPLTSNKYVTPAKLKIFYIGQTGDKRVFTKQFSDQLLTTLPGTPVVAYYDEDSDDFIGHHHTQYVFGYVPETASIGYMQEGTLTYAVTDVLLFTGREDNIGYAANKIIGKQHSLELDPMTVEYEIIRSSRGLESITFKKGAFIGLSVLGDNERPAFGGSTFFTEDAAIQAFVDSFKQFKEEVEIYKSEHNELNNDLPQEFQTLEDLDLKPTESMAEQAKRGLEMRREHGRGGTAVGVARARDISNRKNLSPETVQRMYSFFSRHEVDKKAEGFNPGEDGYPSNGKIACLLWGGDPGYSWATKKYNQIKRIREAIELEEKELEVKLVEETNLQENFTVSDELNSEISTDVVNAAPMEDEEEPKEPEMVYPKDDEKEEYVDKEDKEEEMEKEEEDKEENMSENEEFMADPYEELQKRVYDALLKMYPNVQFEIKQINDEWVVYKEYVYDQNGGKPIYYRIAFVDNGMMAELTGGPVEVHKRYLTTEEIAIVFGSQADMSSSAEAVEAQILEGKENAREQEQTEEFKEINENSDLAALNQAEREELNEYRKKAKLELINSYAELSSDIKNKYSAAHESYDLVSLDKELAFELVQSQRQLKQTGLRVFSVPSNEQKPETILDIVNRYKD